MVVVRNNTRNMKNKAINGAKGAAAGVGGSLFLGPTIGPIAGGFAADQVVGGQTRYTEMGVAIGLASMFMGGGGGGGQTDGVM